MAVRSRYFWLKCSVPWVATGPRAAKTILSSSRPVRFSGSPLSFGLILCLHASLGGLGAI